MKWFVLFLSLTILFLFGFDVKPFNKNEQSDFPLTFEYNSIDTQVVSSDSVIINGFFPFKNHTNAVVIIKEVSPLSGIVPYWNRGPIFPGQNDTIKFQIWYSNQFKSKSFSKVLTVRLDGKDVGKSYLLTVKGELVEEK